MRKHNVNVQKRKKHYTVGAILWLIVEYVSLIFFGLCAVVPVISCVITAFKTQEEYQTTNVMTLPKNWLNFDNFIKAFQTADMGRALKLRDRYGICPGCFHCNRNTACLCIKPF